MTAPAKKGARLPPREIPIRIIVVDPQPGVVIKVQRGRDGLLPPTPEPGAGAGTLKFDFSIRLGDAPGGGPRFLGEFVQGPPTARFVYVNSGARAGQAGTCWDRRAKVSLMSIGQATVAEVLRRPGFVLEARISGRARDGGPMCASVPLLGEGWTVRRA